jgi:hypothetical protein
MAHEGTGRDPRSNDAMQLKKLRSAPELQGEVPSGGRRPREPRTASPLIAGVGRTL